MTGKSPIEGLRDGGLLNISKSTETYTGSGGTSPGDTVTIFENQKSDFIDGYITHGQDGQGAADIEVQESDGSWTEKADGEGTWDVEGTWYGARINNTASSSSYDYDYDFTVRPL